MLSLSKHFLGLTLFSFHYLMKNQLLLYRIFWELIRAIYSFVTLSRKRKQNKVPANLKSIMKRKLYAPKTKKGTRGPQFITF